jgi:adenylate cyclase, class 2
METSGLSCAENVSEERLQVREVEVKYAISTDALAAVVAAAAAAGAQWGLSVYQDDQAYAETGWAFGHPKTGRKFARLRTENGQHLCTVKVPQTGELDCLETEWAVPDRAAADLRLRSEGFWPTIRITKTRRTARWDSITLCLDTVEGLGCFLEAEVLVDDDQDGQELQDWLRQRLATLGIALSPVTETYDALLQQNTPGASTTPPTAADTVPR